MIDNGKLHPANAKLNENSTSLFKNFQTLHRLSAGDDVNQSPPLLASYQTKDKELFCILRPSKFFLPSFFPSLSRQYRVVNVLTRKM